MRHLPPPSLVQQNPFMKPTKIARQFHMPDDEQLRELGRVIVQHAFLDLVLSRTIKMLEQMSEDDANKTWGGVASAKLRKQLGKSAKGKLGASSPVLPLVNALLEKAAAVSSVRNLYAHGQWKNRDGELSIHDLRELQHAPLPSARDLKALASRIRGVADEIDAARNKGGYLRLAWEATLAKP
jgi:hypothetical protein